MHPSLRNEISSSFHFLFCSYSPDKIFKINLIITTQSCDWMNDRKKTEKVTSGEGIHAVSLRDICTCPRVPVPSLNKFSYGVDCYSCSLTSRVKFHLFTSLWSTVIDDLSLELWPWCCFHIYSSQPSYSQVTWGCSQEPSWVTLGPF
jgi:hypothetical protein